MTDEVAGKGVEEQLTQEQLDAQNAEKYRAQLTPNGEADAQVDPNKTDDNKPVRPEHIPEKFWDAEKGEVRVEELAKSYAELEKGKTPPAKAEEGEELTDEQKAEKAEAEKSAREILGLPTPEALTEHRQKMTEKIVAGQPFDDSDYAPFEKLGLEREIVDAVREGLIAQGELHKQSVYKEAGGEDAYKAMIEWARENYTAEEIAAYDHDVHSGDKAVGLNAVRGLAARHREAAGRTGRDVTNIGGTRIAEGYRSKGEMVADMRDPKYAKDEAFRQDVARKVAAARRAGVDLTK